MHFVRSSARLVLRSAAIGLLAVAWAPELRAQEGDAAARAEAMIHEGVELRREGHEGDALELFRKAHALSPSGRALAQMGLAAKSLRLYVDAERFLEAALAAKEDAWVEQNREALASVRDFVAKQLASIRVRSNVEGGELFVNGAFVAKLPLAEPVRVPAGAVQVAVRADGYIAAASDITLPAGETTEVSLELTLEPPVAKVEPSAPRAPIDAPASRRPWIYASAGVGVVGLGVGTVALAIMLDRAAERDSVCAEDTCPPTAEGRAGQRADGEARTAFTWMTIGYGVGLAGLGAAAFLWLTESKPSAGAPLVVAGPTPRGASAQVTWAF